MKRTLLVGAIAGLLTICVATAVQSEPSRSPSLDLPGSHLGTGGLHLDLSGGHASAALSFAGLLPGSVGAQQIWVATNRASSATSGTLSVRVDRVQDKAGPCAVSVDKAAAELAAGIAGCRIAGGVASGTPAQGNLSRLVRFELRTGPAACGPSPAGSSALTPAPPRTLRATQGRRFTVRTADGTDDLALSPGAGSCLVVGISWPPDVTAPGASDPEHPSDNAAQADSVRVDVVFTLDQDTP
jgi:hypothetical protein